VASQTSDIRSELSAISQMLMKHLLLSRGGGGQPYEATRLALPSQSMLLSSEEGEGGLAGEGGEGDVTRKVGDGSSHPATQEERKDRAEEEPEVPGPPPLEVKLEGMRKAVWGMYSQNDETAVVSAIDMLVIYINNLIKYPTVPRFRKIMLASDGYKQRVSAVKGHQVSRLYSASGPKVSSR
jgi:hypothetical protein